MRSYDSAFIENGPYFNISSELCASSDEIQITRKKNGRMERREERERAIRNGTAGGAPEIEDEEIYGQVWETLPDGRRYRNNNKLAESRVRNRGRKSPSGGMFEDSVKGSKNH